MNSTHKKVVCRCGAEFLEEEQYGHDQCQCRPVGLGPAHTLRRQFHIELGVGTSLSDGTISLTKTFTYQQFLVDISNSSSVQLVQLNCSFSRETTTWGGADGDNPRRCRVR